MHSLGVHVAGNITVNNPLVDEQKVNICVSSERVFSMSSLPCGPCPDLSNLNMRVLYENLY